MNNKYYMIMMELDQTEGRGGLGETGICFTTYDVALAFTKTKHMESFTVMGYVNKGAGHSYLIKEKTVPTPYRTLEEFETGRKNTVRENALKKLTPEEIKALGL